MVCRDIGKELSKTGANRFYRMWSQLLQLVEEECANGVGGIKWLQCWVQGFQWLYHLRKKKICLARKQAPNVWLYTDKDWWKKKGKKVLKYIELRWD